MEYGVMASKTPGIFSDLLLQLSNLCDVIPLPVLIIIGLAVIAVYLFFSR